jgi:hypothetical protein
LRRDFAAKGAGTDEEFESMRRSNLALRLQPSLMEEARKAAESAGVALQFGNLKKRLDKARPR